MSRPILIVLSSVVAFNCLCVFTIADILNGTIKESRHREEMLFQEVKNLDVLTSILTDQVKNR